MPFPENRTFQTGLISIVVPIYNYGHYIEGTMESLFAQTYQNWECIVVDDGSTDETAEVVKILTQRDSRIRYLRQANQGQSHARNTGLLASEGEYVQFLDADDLIEPRKFELQVEYLADHPEVDIVYGSARYFEDGKRDLRYSLWDDRPWMPEVSGVREVLAALVVSNIMVISSPLMRWQVIEEVGHFYERMLNEDWDYWLRCAAKGKRFQFADLPGTLALIRIHPRSCSQNQKRMYHAAFTLRERARTFLEDEELLELNRQLLIPLAEWVREDEIQETISEMKQGRWPGAFRRLIKIGIGSKSFREAAKWFFCALVTPFAPRDDFQSIISGPAVNSISRIIRYHFGGWRARF